MERQILISLILLSSILTMNAQTLYLPNGSNGIGSSTNTNIGIGTTSPIGLLDIQKTTSNGEGQSVVNIIGSTNTGNGASLVLNQVWNGNYYKTIFDNSGGAYNGVGSGLKIQTSYWNGTQVYTKAALTLTPTGEMGLGVTSPMGMLDIQKTTSNAEGQSVVNIIGSTSTGNGASLVLNQVWNGNYYKTLIDNSGGAYNGVGSGLKIQTSYWDGSQVNTITALSLSPTGDLGLGTTTPAYKLDVIGTIRAREIIVDLNGADFVFEKEYKLMPLNELEKFVKEQKHLPEVAPAKEMNENGTDLGDLNSKFLQKMEEMTLYIIEQNKAIEELKQALKLQSKEIEKLKPESK
jgi:hypothetical protein